MLRDTRAGNRKERRRDAAELRARNARLPHRLEEVPRELWPPAAMLPTHQRVLRSRDFLVQVHTTKVDGVLRMSINRAEVTSDGAWSDRITWDELQRLKREAGYGDRYALEVFPDDGDIVNVANMRHLWVLPDGAVPDFAWSRKRFEASDV